MYEHMLMPITDYAFEGPYRSVEKIEDRPGVFAVMSLVVKLRKYTLDQLMSEYNRLKGTLRPEREETLENAEI